MAIFLMVSGLLQAVLNAELARRFMPFQWMISGGLLALLANAIYHTPEPETDA